MTDDIRVGVIGVGNMGRHHARVYSEIDGVQLTAIADSNRMAGEKCARQYRCRLYRDYRQMLMEGSLDAVSIAVPTSLHRKVALDCIERRVPVLIEKPIAESVSSAQRIISRARAKRIPVCVGHVERFNPVVQRLKKLIVQGRFGKITVIDIKRVGLYPPQVTDVDVIIDLAVHDIDVCNFLLARKPRQVFTRAGRALNSKRIDYADIFLTYQGVDVVIQVNWITPVKVRDLSLTGIKAYAELSYLDQTLRVYNKGHGREDDIVNIEEINIRKEEPLKKELQQFVEFIRTGKGEVVTAREGLLALQTALKARESHKRNRNIKI